VQKENEPRVRKPACKREEDLRQKVALRHLGEKGTTWINVYVGSGFFYLRWPRKNVDLLHLRIFSAPRDVAENCSCGSVECVGGKLSGAISLLQWAF